MSVMRLMKWYGGPGSRGARRVPSNAAYIAPNASDGRPQAHAIIAFQSNGNPSASVATSTGSTTPS